MEHSKNGSRTKKCAGKALLRWYDEQECDLKFLTNFWQNDLEDGKKWTKKNSPSTWTLDCDAKKSLVFKENYI